MDMSTLSVPNWHKSGIIPLIIPRKNFRLEKLKWMVSYPLFIFNSKNVEKEKKRYRKLVKVV